MPDGANHIAADHLAWAIGFAFSVGGLIAGVLVRYYSERSAIVKEVKAAIAKVEEKWETRFTHHQATVHDAHVEIHKRIERVEQRAEDRLTAQINAMRTEMQAGFASTTLEIRDLTKTIKASQ